MARGYNRVIIMGNLARDPDVRFTPSKQKVARITVAIGRQWKNKTSGELQSHTDFVTVSAWNYVADICDRYLKKGRPVLVEGRLSVRDFDDAKTGQHRWVTEVVADNIVLLGSPRRDDEGMPSASEPGFGNARMHSDAVSGGALGSRREEEGFEDEFPLDFSEMGGTEGPGDVQIPF